MASKSQQEQVRAKFESLSGFLPYIEEIRFPMYKSLKEDLTLSFDWPIVALVGPNGTNKSSILQAISAAPEGRSLAQFWFSTEVDDIDRDLKRESTHRFIYKYRFDKSEVRAECRKYRGSKPFRSSDVPKPLRGKRDPDYWEPTKRVARDKMAPVPKQGFADRLSKNRDRWNQIKKPVVYLDFRAELSAFDKYIHHQSFNRWVQDSTGKRHKAIIKSKWIARALEGTNLPKSERHKLVTAVRDLSSKDVSAIALILGKPVERISIVEHKFFGPTGFTVKLFLSNSDTSYSEAHAGSGEYAVVRLVDAIRRAEKSSLILLDEPEVSLHPGAQIELLKFIENEVLQNGHQVVFSTHSPFLLEGLPREAIKVLGFDATQERVVLVADGCSHTEAFAHLGHTISHSTKPRIIVEDDLVEEMVKAALRRHDPYKLDSLLITPFPGGAGSTVKNVIPSMALAKQTKTGILLDGDQLPPTVVDDRNIIEEAETAYAEGDVTALQNLWKDQFHETALFLFSDTDHVSDLETLYLCITWAYKHLRFLPGGRPEEALAFAEDCAAKPQVRNWKKFWRDRAGEYLNLTNVERKNISSKQILEYQRMVLANLPAKSEFLKGIAASVKTIVDW